MTRVASSARFAGHSQPREGQLPRAPRKWSTPPKGLGRLKKRRLWLLLALLILAGLLSVALASLWNYLGVSFPLPSPTTNLTSLHSPAAPGLAALRAAQTEWAFDAGEPLVVAPITVGRRAYLVAGRTPLTGRVVALDLGSGEVVWTRQLDSISDYPPAAAGDLLFVGTRGGQLLALDRHTGHERWSFEAEASILGQPIVEGGVLYFASTRVYALDAATGKQRWKHKVGGQVTRPIALSEGIVAAVSSDGDLNLIDGGTGKRRLTFPLWFGPSAGPTISGGTVVVSGDGANVQALALRGRDIPMEKAVRYWWTKLWLWDMAPKPPLPRGFLWQQRTIRGITAHPLAADAERIFLGVKDPEQTARIVALSRGTGEVLWQYPVESPVAASATLTGDMMLVGTEAGRIFGLDTTSGRKVWELAVGSPVAAAPAVAGKTILVPSLDGVLYAFQ